MVQTLDFNDPNQREPWNGTKYRDTKEAGRAGLDGTMMASLTRIEHATAIKALTGNNDEVLVVLFRLMGADSLAFEAVLRLRSKRQRKNHNTSEKLLRAYQEMDEATALRVMRFLMVRRQAQSHG